MAARGNIQAQAVMEMDAFFHHGTCHIDMFIVPDIVGVSDSRAFVLTFLFLHYML